VIEISDIIVDLLNEVDSKEEFDYLPNSKFGRLITFFTHMVVSMVTTGNEEESLYLAKDLCLEKIDKKMKELEYLT